MFSHIHTDFIPGPVALDTSSINYKKKYYRVWKVNKTDIDYHMSNYNSMGYTMPEVIQNWPGNGDINNGEAHILAPFADLNENGIYEPSQGEYPYIRGDQAVFFMYNDNIEHTESHGIKFKAEVHGMMYAFNQPADSALWNTVFLTYDVINRSDTSYHNVYLGLWTDLDIGDASDDYIGCDSILNYYYGYNSDENDGDGNGNTYGSHPPSQGVVLLNYPMKTFMYFSNNASVMGNPSTAEEYKKNYGRLLEGWNSFNIWWQWLWRNYYEICFFRFASEWYRVV